MTYVSMDFFNLILFGFHSVLKSVGLCFSPILEKIQPSFLWMLFQPIPSPLPWYTNETNVGSFVIFPQVSESLFIFRPLIWVQATCSDQLSMVCGLQSVLF